MWSTVAPGGARFSGTAENCDVAPACAAAAAAQRRAALFFKGKPHSGRTCQRCAKLAWQTWPTGLRLVYCYCFSRVLLRHATVKLPCSAIGAAPLGIVEAPIFA